MENRWPACDLVSEVLVEAQSCLASIPNWFLRASQKEHRLLLVDKKYHSLLKCLIPWFCIDVSSFWLPSPVVHMSNRPFVVPKLQVWPLDIRIIRILPFLCVCQIYTTCCSTPRLVSRLNHCRIGTSPGGSLHQNSQASTFRDPGHHRDPETKILRRCGKTRSTKTVGRSDQQFKKVGSLFLERDFWARDFWGWPSWGLLKALLFLECIFWDDFWTGYATKISQNHCPQNVRRKMSQ